MRCPNPLHRGSKVAAHGVRRSAAGLHRRFRCRPTGHNPHTFTVLVMVGGPPVPLWSAPPPCPDPAHEGSHVVRNGTYGKRTAKPRQRYRCEFVNADGEKKRHAFTPPLARDHVHAGDGACDACEELRGVHRGETAVARRHSWSARIVARGLEQLSSGASYADVSRWALRTAGAGVRSRRPSTVVAAVAVSPDAPVGEVVDDATDTQTTAADQTTVGDAGFRRFRQRPSATEEEP